MENRDMVRLSILVAAALVAFTVSTAAQSDNPVVTNATRIVMENDRIRIIEINLTPHTKANVVTSATRERVLYMLSDGALILAPPGKKPYEFALSAGEAVLFPPISPTVENDTDGTVRALLVELKERAPVVANKGRVKRRLTTRARAKARKVTVPRAVPKTAAPKAKTKT
jgi:hypothetical protein